MREKATHLGLISNDNKAAIYNIIAQFSYEVKLCLVGNLGAPQLH